MKFALAAQLFFFVSCAFCVKISKRRFVEDYCWRDYDGVVPSDAIQGGRDKNGHPVYIGQVLFYDLLIVGKIYEDDELIHFEHYDEVHTAKNNIKILCSGQPHKFEWIQTTTVKGLNLTNAIEGGYEKDYYTHIGRTFSEGEISVGKVICPLHDCWGLYTTSVGNVRVHTNFEYLSYNWDSETIECDPPIDIRLTA